MTDLLSGNDYRAFKDADIGETVEVTTIDGNTYSFQTTDRKGATLLGVGVAYGQPARFELRGGRGRDDDDDQPFLALGIDEAAVETTDVETGMTHIRGIGEVEVTHERGSVSYDEEVVEFDRRGEETVTLG